MGISEGLFLSRFVNSSDTLARLTVTLGTEPKQPDIKLGALISQCVLTLIRSSVFHGLTDGGGGTRSSRSDHCFLQTGFKIGLKR